MFTHFKKIEHEKYKYETTEKMRVHIPKDEYFKPFRDYLSTRHLIDHKFIKLDNLSLLIMPRYRSDGASGWTFDTPNTFGGAFPHDALYQFMRMGLLPQWCKEYVDRWFYLLLREDHMSAVRANIWYYGVKFGGKKSCALKEFVLFDALKNGDISLKGLGMPGLPRNPKPIKNFKNVTQKPKKRNR